MAREIVGQRCLVPIQNDGSLRAIDAERFVSDALRLFRHPAEQPYRRVVQRAQFEMMLAGRHLDTASRLGRSRRP